MFLEGQGVRTLKVPTSEPCTGGLFRDYDLYKVQSLDEPLVEMDALSLNYWMMKFVQQVSKPSN